ncbi:hypothetical protein HELRODRAFT_88439, partial [Helobdella robusta]|uniref:6-phosphogluconolactonase n=1 Tax=Helobdella robusta TaxID=6412 RepID=T1G726_HELRO
GGSVIKYFSDAIKNTESDWSHWNVLFCDERYVSYDDKESTYGAYYEQFFKHVPIPKEQILNIDYKIPIEDSAKDYENRLKKLVHWDEGSDFLPMVDILLLGLGPDGHVCSLFPGHTLLKEQERWVAAITDSPKPPPNRITLTFPVINNARNLVFVACGEGKSSILKEILENKRLDLPASMVKPVNGNLTWLLDRKAANLLTLPSIQYVHGDL